MKTLLAGPPALEYQPCEAEWRLPTPLFSKVFPTEDMYGLDILIC